MTTVLYSLARSALFRLDPEHAHELALNSLAAMGPAAALLGAGAHGVEGRRVMGIDFPNPVGLAAGLDKNGAYVDALAALGFGFLEIGTVTPRAQPGNAKPRLFRLVEHEALINRLGFNNLGVERLLRNIEKAHFRGVLGINIGKNFDTPLERAVDDYVTALDAVYDRATYVTVNISSPNTAGLRELQSAARLDELLATLMSRRESLAARYGRRKPLVVKVAPDLTAEEVSAIAALALKHRVDGIIATNTTVGREGVSHDPQASESGGLSGRPLLARSTQVLATFARALGDRVPLIGVGGIASGDDARAKIDAGAS
ncbi:MAG TPA: quinone-dependent dihydroorotate dehydrogenase, partial [Usitatibacter sp.]|nr:quinone-dependent dihydroorotate dehydrogenase [Usitatibacter sp.]